MTTAVAPPKLRPRDVITIAVIGGKNVSEQMYQLAKMRLSHPGGVPITEPQQWTGAFVGNKLLAALGWNQLLPHLVWVLEVNRDPTKWGAVATLVLFREFKKRCEAQGTKVQALVMPSNYDLKDALTQLKMHLAIEVWEPD